MEPTADDARAALQTIARAERTAACHSADNGIITLVWGIFVFLFVTVIGIVPRYLTIERITQAAERMEPWEMASGLAVLVMLPVSAVALWSSVYKKRLPVQTPESRQRRFWTIWGVYHTVLVTVYFTGSGLMHRTPSLGDCALIGLVDAAPLIIIGIRQWRQTRTESV